MFIEQGSSHSEHEATGQHLGELVLGVSEPQDVVGSLLVAHETLTGETLSHEAFIA